LNISGAESAKKKRSIGSATQNANRSRQL